ncbi:MAG: manganese efflux pump MntP family protein [Clostridiaceae bacterium]|nr:manganese efflux pump MntP family protein [Clostridiaceae bacterium]
MAIWELMVLAVGLSMDAFAVSICKGLASRRMRWDGALACGLYFGGFQALMPTVGYFVGSRFYTYIERFDHWVAFILLILIGVNMLREAFCEEEKVDSSFAVKGMLVLAVATSIDALAVGVSLACLRTNIALAAAVIGVTTFIFSFAGVRIGNVFGSRYRKKAVIAGGVILIGIGLKILVEHLISG